jgi:hypothetical protein
MSMDRASADLNTAGSEWANAGQWDKASYDWMLAATDDPSMDWNTPSSAANGSSWDRTAGWDNAGWD